LTATITAASVCANVLLKNALFDMVSPDLY